MITRWKEALVSNFMASSSSSKVNLPPSVEEMLDKICRDQNVDPADYLARKTLSSLDEAHSLDTLQKISNIKIKKSLSCLIMHLVCKDAGSKNENGCSQGRRSPASVSCQYETNSTASSPKRPLGQMTSPQLLALGELEFRKAFLILSYLGKNRLEDVLKKDEIQRMNHLPMACVEEEVWKAFGRHSLCDEDRRNKVDWNSDKTHLYYCHVDPDGSITFKGPYLDKTRTHLQRVLGDDNVLNVRFAEMTSNKAKSANCFGVSNALYYNLGREGIDVGLRRYHFFVFKDGGKEEKKNPTSSSVKCYFVCMDSTASVDEKKPCILFGKSIREARSLFMHVHTVPNMAKYMPRFSLILSKTMKLDIDLDSVHVELIDDIPCRDEEGNIVHIDGERMIHTDGTGFISEDLAVKCPKNVFKGDYSIHGDLERKTLTKEPPLLIQCRLFYKGYAVKGTLLLNKMLRQKTIQIRPSMLKVKRDPELSNVPSFNSLEVVSTSYQPKRSCLSKFLIALLDYGGVPREYFMELLNNALGDAQRIHSNKRSALKVVMKYADMDGYLATKMIGSGIPLDEPFLKSHLSMLLREERKSLKEGKLPVSESYYLMGTADPTGKLNANEVCVILDNGQISGHVLVFKHPGLHFGDIHVLKATYVEDLESFVGNAKYAIFFPTKGPRSIADEIANSDFDGDMYWVSRNQELLRCFKASEPWERCRLKRKVHQCKPTDFSEEELENELFKQFLKNRFSPSYAVGTAADSWLAFMDRLLTFDVCEKEKQCMQENMLELINLYYDALDAPKSGLKIDVSQELKAEQFPHYMKNRRKSYHSTSILGQIYDTVKEFHRNSPSSEEVQLLPCFCQNVPDSCLTMWKKLYCDYRAEMSSAMSTSGESKDSATEVIQRYKQILYEAPEFEESPKRREDIFNEALAIYQICYEYAKDKRVGLCGFAWKVAGSALCSLYMLKQGEDTMVWAQSVVRELFG